MTVVLGVASVSDLFRGLPITGRISTHALSTTGLILLLVVYRRRNSEARDRDRRYLPPPVGR
ncbi:hypothetical protein ACWED2_10045 [Amycolatopsis sp. NPDC005003]